MFAEQPRLTAGSGAGLSKLSVSLVKRHELCLLSDDCEIAAAAAASSDEASNMVILRLSWKLRVHGYLAKFVVVCGAIAFALEAVGGTLPSEGSSGLGPNRNRLAAGLRAARSAEWVGFVMICAGLINIWVTNGRVSLLVAFWANLVGMVFTSVGLVISCLLLALYFRLRDAEATQELLNASLLTSFVLLAQLSALLAILTHTAAYHPYRLFALANRLRADSGVTMTTSDTATAQPPAALTVILDADV